MILLGRDGQRGYAGESNGNVFIWDLSKGEVAKVLAPHSNAVSSLAVDAGDRYLASGSWDQTVKLWTLPTGELLHTLTGHTGAGVISVAIDDGGRYLASKGANGKINLWAVPEGKWLQSWPSGHIASLAMDPAGRLLASNSPVYWEDVVLWELPTGEPVQTSGDPWQPVKSLAFDPRGKYLATKPGDDTVLLNALPSLQPLVTLVAVAGGQWGVVTPDGYLDGPQRGARWQETRCSCGMPTGPWPDYGLPDSGGDFSESYSWQIGMPRAVSGLLPRLLQDDTDFRLAKLRRLLASLPRRP